MPALLILAVISWLLGSGKSRSKAGEPTLFTALEVRPGRRWGAFFVSIAAHAFGVLLVLIASDLFSGPDDDFLPRQLALHALVIRLPDHIYLAPATGRTFPLTAHLKRTPRVTVRRKDLRKYAEGGMEAKLTAPTTTPAPDAQPSLFSMAIPPLDSPQAEPRKFELPEMATRAAATTRPG